MANINVKVLAASEAPISTCQWCLVVIQRINVEKLNTLSMHHVVIPF